MDDPRHREAEALIANQGNRQRTECVVAGILAAKQAGHVEQIVRQAVREELKSLQYQLPKTLPEEKVDGTQLADLPDSLIHALDEI